jgi:hypothetical protein
LHPHIAMVTPATIRMIRICRMDTSYQEEPRQ